MKVSLIPQLKTPATGSQYNGNGLSVINAASGKEQLPLITIPTTLNNIYIRSGNRGDTALGSGFVPGGNKQQLFTLNTTSGKLTLQGVAHNNAAWWSDWIAGQ